MKSMLPFPGRLLLALALFSSLLAGCSAANSTPAATAAPTQDQATIVAAAVNTLSAQMTEQALRNPTATFTPQPTATATVVPTDTPVPATPTLSTPSTATATQAPALSAQALYAGTFPNSKNKYQPNEKFGLALGFKNTGTVPWEPGFKVKITGFKGEITVQQEAELGKAVAPGDKVEFDLWAFGSETLGTHIWYFQLYNRNGAAVPGGAISFTYTSY